MNLVTSDSSYLLGLKGRPSFQVDFRYSRRLQQVCRRSDKSKTNVNELTKF